MMLPITPDISIPAHEIDIQAVRSQGPGGQNVNKVASAIHLRFNIPRSSLPEAWKNRLMQLQDQRISRDGTLVIKAQKSRSQEKNKTQALERLQTLVQSVTTSPNERIPTRPSGSARKKRLEHKRGRSQIKLMRAKIME